MQEVLVQYYGEVVHVDVHVARIVIWEIFIIHVVVHLYKLANHYQSTPTSDYHLRELRKIEVDLFSWKALQV